jgi:hypothetical protein
MEKRLPSSESPITIRKTAITTVAT